MKLLRRLLLGRSSKLGFFSDVAMVGAAAAKVARKSGDGPASRVGPGQWLLVGGAAFRLLRRVRTVRRNRRLAASTD